jgi:uncharacterized protein YcnI
MTARTRSVVLAGVVAAIAAAAPAAQAHVQVRPTTAAPGDSVLFQILVPGESEARTTEVALQVPDGVLPFSWEDTPGWTRRVTLADDGSIDVVRWRGRLATDGFVRFAFLAATPEQEGEIAWRAIQTYDNGEKVRWIGPTDSDTPAAVTEITESAPRENAGGEGSAAEAQQEAAGTGGAAAEQTATPAPATQQTAADDDGGSDTLALVLALVALVLGAIALFVSLTRRRAQQPA